MIRISLLAFLFQITISPLFAQTDSSGMIVYRLHYETDEPAADRFDTLYFNRGHYLYISQWKGTEYTDTRGYTITRKPKNKRFYYPATLDYRVTLEQNYRKKSITYQKDNPDKMNWTLVNEFKDIGDYRAQKATATSSPFIEEGTMIAWFTTDVPVPVGPSELTGLPGLMLEAYLYPDYHHKWSVEKIEFKPVQITEPDATNYTLKKKSKKNKGRNREKMSELLNSDGK